MIEVAKVPAVFGSSYKRIGLYSEIHECQNSKLRASLRFDRRVKCSSIIKLRWVSFLGNFVSYCGNAFEITFLSIAVTPEDY